MTYADHGSKDYEALLSDDEPLPEPGPILRDVRSRSWALTHLIFLTTYSLLFVFLVYKETNIVKFWQAQDLISCTFFKGTAKST